jgi:threonine/homoserine/homoserine lactone efflux protein
MHFADAVVKGILLGLFMAISVGPTLFAVIRYSLNHSYKAGLAFVLGVSFSDILYVAVANFAATWLEVLNDHKTTIAYAGAAILIIVGLAGVLKKYKPVKPSTGKIKITGSHYFTIWLSGFLINTINPGVIIIWLGAVTAIANTTTLYRVTFFGSCLLIVLGIDFIKVFLADSIRRKLTIRRIMYLQKTSAICILVVGIALLVSTAFNIHFTDKEEVNVPVGSKATATAPAMILTNR